MTAKQRRDAREPLAPAGRIVHEYLEEVSGVVGVYQYGLVFELPDGVRMVERVLNEIIPPLASVDAWQAELTSYRRKALVCIAQRIAERQGVTA